METPAALKQTR